jgi:deoxycytidine triphosphate deaminase
MPAPRTMIENCEQTMRQLADGDIVERKALMRVLRMLSAMSRQQTLAVSQDFEAQPEMFDGRLLLRAAEPCTIPPGAAARVRTSASATPPDGCLALLSTFESAPPDFPVPVRRWQTPFDASTVLLRNHHHSACRIDQGAPVAELAFVRLADLRVQRVKAQL